MLSGTIFGLVAIGHALRSLLAKELDDTERNLNRAFGFGAMEFVFLVSAGILQWFQL
jgi:hypothetical protein